MPTSLFLALNIEKKQKIFTAGLSEFGTYGYENSSTNRIVAKAGISKGSLFKYFPTKEDFYFYVLDAVTSALVSDLKEKANTLSADLFQRITDYSVMEFSWYILHPAEALLIVKAFTESDTDIYRKTVLKYGSVEQDLYYWFLQDIDTTGFQWDRQKTVDLIKWFLKGFNQDFLAQIPRLPDVDFEKTKQKYEKELSEYMEMLKNGILE